MSNTAFLISIKPQFAEMIFSGKKTVELRRVPPKAAPGDLALVYVSSPVKELQGCFEVSRIDSGSPSALWKRCGKQSGVSRQTFMDYFQGKAVAHALVIKRAWKLPAAVRLASLRERRSGFRPPQNFQYLKECIFSTDGERRAAE
jgi:predicted transcriptional regulator